MPYASLAEFLAELQDHGELVRIAASVDSSLELAAISDRVARSSTSGGPALLFENVKNSTIPVVTNLLGSRRRLCRCLGVAELDDIAPELDRRLQQEQSSGWLGAMKLVPSGDGFAKWSPKLVKTAACQQVVRIGRDTNLWDLPVPRSWPHERNPVITSGQLVTCDPDSGRTCIYSSPIVVTGEHELAWYAGTSEQSELVKRSIELNRNLPVAISLGGDPVFTLATSMSGIDDVRSFTGLLRGTGMEVVRCRTSELEVPAGSEIVIEGYIDAANSKSATPIAVASGNGRYVERTLPLIQVTAITQRANPVLPAKIIAPPPSEESWIGLVAERMMLPLLKRLVPEIVDIHQPFAGAGRNFMFVSIHKTIGYQARRVLHALWGMQSPGTTKMIVIVDADIDVRREDLVWFTVGNNACPAHDFILSDGLLRDDDYTSLSATLGSRVGIDATRKVHGERENPWPQLLTTSNEIVARVTDRWKEYGLETSGRG